MRRSLLEQAAAAIAANPGSHQDSGALALLAAFPVHAEALDEGAPFDSALTTLAALRHAAAARSTATGDAISRALKTAASDARYVPWMAEAPELAAIRNTHLTVPTSASGIWAGFQETVPPTAGNSETGHQQVANLTLAPQTPLEISSSIKDGSFFDNAALVETVRHGIAPGSALNFTFLLSGTRGDDGRVHSAWDHLEAFLDLVFRRLQADPARVRMQAVLDGRDSSPRGSIEETRGAGRYLDRLEALLARYGATGCLAWVVGRSIAMDRDYRENNTRAAFLLLAAASGEQVSGFEAVRAAVAKSHAAGLTDSDIPPIAVLDSAGRARTVAGGQSFVNLMYRPDRQRSTTAALLGARNFLQRESARRGRSYALDWLLPLPGLRVCTLSEYHPDFADRYGAAVAYPVRPQRANLLSLWPELMPGERYALVAESVKSLHMGYFLRGRRPPPDDGPEDRDLIPSLSDSDGVHSDSDFVRHPAMRNAEVAAAVIRRLAECRHRLICCNLSAPDMIGHLLPDGPAVDDAGRKSVSAAVAAYESTARAVATITREAARRGYSVVVTSDHGNIEDEGPAHSANDVLTTVIAPHGTYTPAPRPQFQARLFDISWTIARILGIEDATREALSRSGPVDWASPFTGRAITS
jgi:2,3-bisphosphoglycerate-independent phosphoglycerate mutase